MQWQNITITYSKSRYGTQSVARLASLLAAVIKISKSCKKWLMYNCTNVSQDTRLEVTSDPGLGTFPSNPLSQSIFKLNSIASCVTGTQTGHTRARGDHKPRWWSSLRKSIPQSTIPWRQGSSRHHPSPGFTMIGTRYPCNCIKECREIRTTSARSKNLGQVFLPYTTFLWSHILQRRDLIIKLNCSKPSNSFLLKDIIASNWPFLDTAALEKIWWWMTFVFQEAAACERDLNDHVGPSSSH